MPVTFSSGCSCKRLTIAMPREVRELSWISYAFRRKVRPKFVKKAM